jgi:NAD-dependent deacetylase
MKPLDLTAYRSITILTGAGVSVASGLPTYRGPDGLWECEEIARLVDARYLPDSLPGLWRLYRDRRERALAAEPNAAHRAIAVLQERAAAEGRRVDLLTQNVDGLHQRAASPEVVELHGSAFRTRCTNAHCTLPAFADASLPDDVPVCPECGAPLRPDVTLFGETLPSAALWAAERALRSSDLFLAVGTSGVVWPAADFVRVAKHVGARTVAINVEPMDPPHPDFDDEVIGPAERVLPVLFGTED